MVDLIGRYEYGMKTRLYEIVNYLVRGNRLSGAQRPAYVHDVKSVDIMAPLMPGKMLNAAVNFYTHVGETGTAEEQKKAEAERRAKRGVPYLFLKPTRGAVVGDGDDVVIPFGRDRVDWEVELGIVIGRAARDVPADKAAEHIFGYMVTVDVSDRGGRPPDSRPGSDWLVGKGHDTFAPMGPWIVPKEFYGDPMKRLRQTLTVDGKVMQEAGASDMIHSIYELIEYGSSIITLFPGDVVNNGTSGGTGMGQAYRGAERFLKPGEKMTASIDGIGSITMNVVGEQAPPPGTGSRLPRSAPTASSSSVRRHGRPSGAAVAVLPARFTAPPPARHSTPDRHAVADAHDRDVVGPGRHIRNGEARAADGDGGQAGASGRQTGDDGEGRGVAAGAPGQGHG